MFHRSDPLLKQAKLYVLRHTSLSSPESNSRVSLSFHNEPVFNLAITNVHNGTCRVGHRNNDRLWSIPFSLISAFIYFLFLFLNLGFAQLPLCAIYLGYPYLFTVFFSNESQA